MRQVLTYLLATAFSLPALAQDVNEPVRTVITSPDSIVAKSAQEPAPFIVEKDSSICISTSRLKRMGRELVVMMNIDVTRNVESDQSVVLYPVIQDSIGNMQQLPAIYINGRRQHVFYEREIAGRDKETLALRRHNSQAEKIHYLRSVPFSTWMRNAELTLIEKECGCGIPKKSATTYVTNLGDVRTPSLAFITPHVEEVKNREERGSAFLDFPVNLTEIQPEYRANADELKKIDNSINIVRNDTNVVITDINIHGYASPEGPYDNNERLSRERTLALKDYVIDYYGISESLITTGSTAEDCEGFRNFLIKSTIPHKREILEIVDGEGTPDAKEYKIKRLYSGDYEYIAENWLPALRHSDYVISYVVRAFTVDQAKQVFRTNPKNLSIEEMFRIAQTYPQGSPEYNNVFMTAVLLNPENETANFNAACICLLRRDPYMAELYLSKSKETPEKVLATGVLHLLKGDYEEAEAFFKKAKELGVKEAEENIKLLNDFY